MTLCAILALTALLPSPPSAALPNTETVTNLPLAVEAARLGAVRFTVALDASPSNNVEFAVGNDADADGRLSLEEADFTFGYDCGVWFYADTQTGVVTEEEAPTEGRISHTLEIGRREFAPSWNAVRIVCRGTDETTSILTLDRYYPGLLLMIR